MYQIKHAGPRTQRWDDHAEEIKGGERRLRGRILKVIIETCLLRKRRRSSLRDRPPPRGRTSNIKTSTGFARSGATREDVALFAPAMRPPCEKIKGAGGISSLQERRNFPWTWGLPAGQPSRNRQGGQGAGGLGIIDRGPAMEAVTAHIRPFENAAYPYCVPLRRGTRRNLLEVYGTRNALTLLQQRNVGRRGQILLPTHGEGAEATVFGMVLNATAG